MNPTSNAGIFPRRLGRMARFSAPNYGCCVPNLAACFMVLALAVLGISAPAQDTAMARAASVLQPQTYVSLQPVPRGRAFEIAVVAKVTPGFHVNAHEPSEEYLIPTKITADLPA